MPPSSHRSRPRWWPKDEPWPPQGNSDVWRQHRRFFFRRAFIIFFFVVLVLIGSCGGLYWLTSQIVRWAGLPPQALPFLTFSVFIVVLSAFTLALRNVLRLMRPLGDLIEAVGRVEAGDYTARLVERGPREVRALARAFNAMTTRLRDNEHQRRALLADITHELRTPLTVMQGNLEALLDGVYPADPAHLAPLLEETRVMARLIDDLRTLSLAESGGLQLHPETTDLNILLTETLAAFRAPAEQKGVTLQADLTHELPLIEIDPERIREVVANLLTNALRHTPRAGQILVAAEVADEGPMRVIVRDTGSGIAPEALPHIFDRFYKSADSGGSGLGLAIAKNLVTAHGGTITAESQLTVGTTIQFTLPIK